MVERARVCGHALLSRMCLYAKVKQTAQLVLSFPLKAHRGSGSTEMGHIWFFFNLFPFLDNLITSDCVDAAKSRLVQGQSAGVHMGDDRTERKWEGVVAF